MKPKIICLNPKCNEVPLISLSYSDNYSKIKADCPFHHYKYNLEEYLSLIHNIKKEYSTTCIEHKEKYQGFSLDTSLNVCSQCLVEEKGKIMFFEDLKPSEYNKSKFSDKSLSQLYSIIYENFNEAKNNERLVAGLYLNYEYINSFIKEEPIKSDEISISENDFPFHEQLENSYTYPFKTNFKYLIRCITEKNEIEVLNIEKNEYICNYSDNNYNLKIELSPFYYDIFLTVAIKEIKIWKILEKEIKNQTSIYLDNDKENFTFAKFSPIDEKIIITISENFSIKIWDLEKIFYIHEINCIRKTIQNIIFCPSNESILGFYNIQNLYIYDINSKKIIYNIRKSQLLYSNFIGSDKLIVIDENNIEINNYKKGLVLNKITNNYGFSNRYFYKDELLYVLHNHLTIINLNNDEINIFKEYTNSKYNNLNNVMFIENRYKNEKSNFLNILNYNNKKGIILSLNINHSQAESTKNELKKNSNYFIKQNKQRLYLESELSFNRIEINENEIYLKNYFKNKEINDILINNFNIDLKQKKLNVENNLNNYKLKNTLEKEYFQLISLLIQDNTNKELIKKYLLFLKNNESELMKTLIIETYKNEYNYYCVLFSCEEIKNNLKEIKDLSEKEKFIKLLNEIKDLTTYKKYDDFKSKIDKSKLGRFNQKIDFYQNNELYWYRNTNLVLYAITKLPLEKFDKIRYCIQQVINRKILEEKKIVENKNRLSILIIYFVTSQQEIIYDYNLNLVSSFSVNSEQEFEALLQNKGFVNNNGKFYLPNEKDIELEPKKDKNICIDNYILNKRKNLNLLNYQMLNYDIIYDNFYIKIDTDKIKKFLSKFLVSNLFKEIYYYLYPDNIIFPFKDLESAEEFIKENLNFLPMINEKAHGSTDKFTLEIYLYLEPKEFYKIPKDFNQNDEDNLFLLSGFMTGELVKTGMHEINYDMYNIYYYHSNGTVPFQMPKKKINRESWREIEILLFGNEIISLNIKQTLYLNYLLFTQI